MFCAYSKCVALCTEVDSYAQGKLFLILRVESYIRAVVKLGPELGVFFRARLSFSQMNYKNRVRI